MADKRRLNLSFSLTSPQQREAWRILSSIPAGQRTDAVCRMVCKAHEQDALLSAIQGKDAMPGIVKAAMDSAQAKAEQAGKNSYEQICADSAAAYAARNPHTKKEEI